MTRSILTTIRHWLGGIRFYIALITLIATAEIYWWTVSVYGDSSTTLIRLQEIYAWTAVGFLVAALSVGPLTAIFKNLPGKSLLRDARRMFGISAAWFASWHVGISYVSQFQAANPFSLPGEYQLAFGLGLLAFVILLALTFTSFNAAFRKLGIWWFRLHRLIYLAVLLILLHAFMIGVHATTLPFIGTLAVMAVLFFAAQAYLGFGPGREPTTIKSIAVCYGLLVTVGIFAYGFTQPDTAVPISSSTGGTYEAR